MSDYDEGNNVVNWGADDDDDDIQVSSPETIARPAPLAFPRQSDLSGPTSHSDNYGYDNGSNETAVESVGAINTTHNIISIESTGEGEQMTVVQVDSTGEQVSTVVDLALPPLEEDEAREITDRIKSTTNLLYLLIKRAHAGKAWKALGYTSFESYVKEEFNYSRSYAYKLLNQANVIEAIESVAPEGTEVYVGELTARGLKKSLPELLEAIEERTEYAEPEEARAIIEDIIQETKDRKDEEDSFGEDFDEDFENSEFTGGSSSAFDYIDEEDDSLDEFLGGDDPSIVVHKLENLYTLLTSLQNFADLDEKDNLSDLLPLIPQERREEVSSLIETNTRWLSKLDSAWNEYLQENGSENDSNEDEENFDYEDDNNF